MKGLAARLTSHDAQLRVLYVSGYSDEANAAHGMFPGRVPLLRKPFTPNKLAERIRTILDRRE